MVPSTLLSGALFTYVLLSGVVGACGTNDSVRFLLHIRVGASLKPHKLVVLHGDDAETAALRFCNSLLAPGSDASSCIKFVIPMVERRMSWANTKRSFMPVHHGQDLLRSVDFDAETPRFNVNSPHELWDGVAFLRREGYAVFSGVASPDEVSTAEDLMWDYFESLGVGILRGDPKTWDEIPANEYGILLQFGIGQSAAMWHIRTLPNIHKVFSAVWGTDDLIVDFGGAVIFRPLVSNCTERWRTAEGWMHVDHNARRRPGLQTIQSSFLLTPQNKSNGGLVVIPRSWKHHDAVSHRASTYWNAADDNHFLLIPPGDPVLESAQPRFVAAERGDLVMWDSRTVHCNTAGEPSLTPTGFPEVQNENVRADHQTMQATVEGESLEFQNISPFMCNATSEFTNIRSLRRLAALVSMAPRSMATEDVLALRRKAVHNRQTTTHWPFLFVADDPSPHLEGDLHLTPLQKKLIG